MRVTAEDPRFTEWGNRKPSKRKTRGGRASKAKTYKRYDPVSGKLARVTEDDPRFDLWPSRKPSKKKQREAAVAEAVRDPGAAAERVVKAAPSIVGDAVAKGAESVLKTAPVVVAREVRRAGGLKAAAQKMAPALAVLGKGAGALAVALGAFYAIAKVTQYERERTRAQLVKRSEELGARYNDTRRKVLAAYATTEWSAVPAAVRDAVDGQYLEAMRRLTLNLNATPGAIR